MTDPREVARLVLEPDFTVAGALALVEPGDIAAAFESFSNMPPLKQLEPKLDGETSNEVRACLKAIGMACWPRMPNKSEWLDANLMVLSDLPGRILRPAAREAVHRNYQFENEPQAAIREIAKGKADRNALALYRLREMMKEIERAMSGTPLLEAQPHLWTAESIDDANETFRGLGIETRYGLGEAGACIAGTVADFPDPEIKHTGDIDAEKITDQ